MSSLPLCLAQLRHGEIERLYRLRYEVRSPSRNSRRLGFPMARVGTRSISRDQDAAIQRVSSGSQSDFDGDWFFSLVGHCWNREF